MGPDPAGRDGHPGRLQHLVLPQPIWGDARLLDAIRSLRRPAQRMPALVVDSFYALINGEANGMVLTAAMRTGNLAALVRIDETDRPALFAWLGK